MSNLDDIINKANVGGHAGVPAQRVTCTDGFSMSVIAGGGAYSTPRPAICSTVVAGLCPGVKMPMLNQVDCTYTGPFSEVEIGFPSESPEPWSSWSQYVEDRDDPTETIYAYVPVDLVRALVAIHGGEAS